MTYLRPVALGTGDRCVGHRGSEQEVGAASTNWRSHLWHIQRIPSPLASEVAGGFNSSGKRQLGTPVREIERRHPRFPECVAASVPHFPILQSSPTLPCPRADLFRGP